MSDDPSGTRRGRGSDAERPVQTLTPAVRLAIIHCSVDGSIPSGNLFVYLIGRVLANPDGLVMKLSIDYLVYTSPSSSSYFGIRVLHQGRSAVGAVAACWSAAAGTSLAIHLVGTDGNKMRSCCCCCVRRKGEGGEGGGGGCNMRPHASTRTVELDGACTSTPDTSIHIISAFYCKF